MRAGVGTGQALGVLTRGLVNGTCPNCSRHSMFRGLYAMHERCPRCGVLYEVESGAWLGTLAIGYGFAALVIVALILAEFAWHPFEALGLDPLYAITAIGIVSAVVLYRPAKGLWFALLWLYGFTGDSDPRGDNQPS